MTAKTPHQAASAMERAGPPAGRGARSVGYGVMGLAFGRGDVLAFRRVTASSRGPSYTAVWHRDPGHCWTVYTSTAEEAGDTLYYRRAAGRVLVAEIGLHWTDEYRLALSVPDHHVEWALRFEPTLATRAFNALGLLLPLSAATGLLARAGGSGRTAVGTPRLQGRTPSGHRFRIQPRRVWVATAAAATVDGRDLGPIEPRAELSLPDPLSHDGVLRTRGLFVVGREVYQDDR